MNKFILILFLIGISNGTFGICGSTGLTLTEAFFKGGYRGIFLLVK